MIRVAINGFGRIGRYVGKLLLERDDVELVAINDLADAESLAYLLRYDTIYGRYQSNVECRTSNIIVDGHEINILSEKEPERLPWKNLNIDVVIESTGRFEKREEAAKHLKAGARAVIITAPSSSGDHPAPTVLRGVNDDHVPHEPVINAASCTTNAIAPTIQVLEDAFGVESSLMTTVHAYTATQAIVDGPGGRDYRRGRAAALNIVPSSTGAAIATTEAIPTLKRRFDGIALRVPVAAGSIADITAVLKEETSVAEVNEAFKRAATFPEYQGILTVTEDPIVSSDILGNPHSAIVDLDLTRVIGNLVKVFAWYDNEAGYSHRVVELVVKLAATQ